eukprot:811266-Pleurochrysis_carterae.AAC.3
MRDHGNMLNQEIPKRRRSIESHLVHLNSKYPIIHILLRIPLKSKLPCRSRDSCAISMRATAGRLGPAQRIVASVAVTVCYHAAAIAPHAPQV